MLGKASAHPVAVAGEHPVVVAVVAGGGSVGSSSRPVVDSSRSGSVGSSGRPVVNSSGSGSVGSSGHPVVNSSGSGSLPFLFKK